MPSLKWIPAILTEKSGAQSYSHDASAEASLVGGRMHMGSDDNSLINVWVYNNNKIKVHKPLIRGLEVTPRLVLTVFTGCGTCRGIHSFLKLK
jgi:hypothetical protein